MIPKIIHYCWFGNSEFSDLHKVCISTWKEKLHDYEFVLWNEENSPMEIPFIKHYYRKKQWAFVSDYVRLYAVYNYGGIYLDVDMEVIKPFDPLLTNMAFLGEEKKGVINSGVIGSQKNCLFIKECMQVLEDRFENKKRYWVAPEVTTRTYETFFDKNKITIYPSEYFYPYNPYDKGKETLFYKNITKNTYAIHHWGHSWKLSLYERARKKIESYLIK